MPRMSPGVLEGLGLSWRPSFAASLLRAPDHIDFVEVIAETCFGAPDRRREAQAIAEIWPVVPHGIDLSLGSATGIDRDRADRLGKLARALRSPVVTEHVALTRVRDRSLGHLVGVPYTHEAARIVARNSAVARRSLPDVPFLLENAARTMAWPEDALGEGEFYRRVVELSGCGLLLDVANVYANALNSNRPPIELLESYPLEHVRLVHVAGGKWRRGFYADSHDTAVCDAALELLTRVTERCGPVPVVLERDKNLPAFDEIQLELARIRKSVGDARTVVAREPTTAPAGLAETTSRPCAADRQDALLSALDGTAAGDFDPVHVRRTREILRRKRDEHAECARDRVPSARGIRGWIPALRNAWISTVGPRIKPKETETP